MPERSIHDNVVVSYEVNGASRRIVLHSRFEGQDEFTDVVFEGVLAYYFENDNFGNILFEIDELPVAQLVSDNRDLFEKGCRWAWPGSWNVSPEATVDYLQSQEARAFDIASSYGLTGWVVAKSYRLEVAPGEALG